MTRVKSKLAKAAKAAAPASLGIANFLASAPPALLCAARPVAATKTAEGSEDEEDGSDNEDERLLQLRRLERDEEEGEDGQGNDWMAHYAGSSEEEDDEDDEGEEEDEEAEAPPPPPPRKVAKSAKPSSTASAALQARPAVALGAEASARVTVLEARGEQARTKGASGRAAGAAAAAAAAAAPAAPAPPKEKRTLPAAFVPKAPSACVFVGNLPLDVAADSLTAKLSAFGALKRVHMEMGNNGKPQGFGYAEFATPAAAAAAAAAGAFSLGGRDAKLLSYTPQLNYRNPDGSRRKEKKKKAAASGGGGGGGGGSGGGSGGERRDQKRARE